MSIGERREEANKKENWPVVVNNQFPRVSEYIPLEYLAA